VSLPNRSNPAWALLLLFSSILGGVGHTLVDQSLRGKLWTPGSETSISPRDAHKLYAEHLAFFIDASGAESYSRGHLPGAHPIEPAEWDSRIAALLIAWPNGSTAIVSCRSNCGSGDLIAKRLREVNLGPVLVLEGGIEAWEAAGLPMER
jgi:rhodanese-related sulfurtransferase